jgi:glycosyltransferase involved in cell wall biosynthesis
MRILFVHQNFPGQYKFIAEALASQPGNEVVALAVNKRAVPQGVRVVLYQHKNPPPGAHALANDFHGKVAWGEAAARAAVGLRQAGFIPDLIIGHPGWGEMLFLKDVFPGARMLSFMEFYYRSENADVNFDPHFQVKDEETFWRLRARNAPFLLSIEASDWSVSPTKWQWSQLPAFARQRTSIIHEGVDTDKIRPDPAASIKLGRGGTFRPGDEIITFVNRNLEPYRGYHVFMRALPEILSKRANARAVIVGADGASYGPAPRTGTWKNIYRDEVASRLDMSRVHFVGLVPYATYINLLQVSAAHVYLTYPFVLSWSMLEAMAAECLIIGSKTPPVEEVIVDGESGLLTDFHSPDALAERTIEALAQPEKFRDLRKHAREKIVRDYDLRTVCLPQHLRLIDDVASGRLPPAYTGT